MSSPDAVVRHMQWQATRDREIMTALLVDAKNQIIDHVTVSVGDSASASVYPVEVFRPAIIARASSIILVHNHPSGDCTPSACDVDLTRQLATVGRALGITILDHIIIGPGFSRYSFSENGMTELWP